mgnify:CR=1 FL=1
MSNSNKKYEDMAEHKKNNRPEKKPKMDATTIATGKRLLKICNGQLQIPVYPCVHLYLAECSCFYLGISVSEISTG